MTKPNKPRLGRGLSSLIRHDISEPTSPPPRPSEPSIPQPGSANESAPARISEISIDQIRVNPAQPRRTFDPERLAALAESIKARGALQPVVVRALDNGYELIAGERRLRASRLAGLKQIPVVVRTVRDDEMLEVALIENVQRENLNPVEKAKAYQLLAQKYGLSQEQIAQKMGEDRASVANTIRLLGLSEGCLEMLSAGELSVGHAKVLLAIVDGSEQLQLARRIVDEGWSVRRAEQSVSEAKSSGGGGGGTPPVAAPPRPAVREMQDRLAAALGTKVRIKEGRRKHSGRITIEYYNLADFERIIHLLGIETADII